MGANEDEIFSIVTWKRNLENDIAKMTQNITRMEYVVGQTSNNFYNLETKVKKSGIKLARLSRNLSRLEKLREEIDSLKSQLATINKDN